MRHVCATATGGHATLRRVRTRLTALFVAALVATTAACGGGGDDRLSQEEFQEQANAICGKYEQKLKDLGSPSSPADIPDFVRNGVPLLRQGLAELRALKPPADVQEDYDRMLDETAKAIPAAEDLAAAVDKTDVAGVQKASKALQQASDASDKIALELGLDRCAEK